MFLTFFLGRGNSRGIYPIGLIQEKRHTRIRPTDNGRGKLRDGNQTQDLVPTTQDRVNCKI